MRQPTRARAREDGRRELLDAVGMTVRLQRAVGCVATAPWAKHAPANALRALINPANEALIGTSRPYSPRGGPVPAKPPPSLSRTTSGWGGMDAGENMLYPTQVVDGLVHQHGGQALRTALAQAPVIEERPNGEHVRCRVGEAVLTPSPPTLPFDVIAHTPPPFWPSTPDADQLALHDAQLTSCFVSALHATSRAAADAGKTQLFLALPIIGSGARGAPELAAARILVRAIRSSQEAAAQLPVEVVVRVVVPAENSSLLQSVMDMEVDGAMESGMVRCAGVHRNSPPPESGA